MVLESTSPLVLRSPVQGRPAIAWAVVLSQGARGLELAVTFLDSTVGGIALCLLNGTGLFDASKGGHVTGRIKDMMIVRGRTVSRTILRSLCEGTCLSCVGGGLSCSKMRRTLSIASWRRRLRLAVARVFQVLLGTVMMRLAAYSGPESRVAWRKATARQAQDSAWKGIDLG